MKSEHKTDHNLREELRELRRRIFELEAVEAQSKRTEEALRESERKYKFLVDHSNEIILILSKKGKILFTNKTALGSFGYSEEEIVGKFIANFLTKDSLGKSLYALAQEFLGHPQPEMEVKAKTKSGELRYLKVAMGSAPIYDKGKFIGVIVCASDVTAVRKKDQELREREMRFRELWEHAPVAYHTTDTKGIITDANQTEADLLGYTKEELAGKSVFDLILPEQRAEARRRFQQKVSGQPAPRTKDLIFVKKDGSKIYVAIDDSLERDRAGRAISVRTAMADITKIKEAEWASKISEEHFKNLVEKAGIAISIDDNEGRLKYFNGRFAEIFGYRAEEMKDKLISSIIHPDDVETVMSYHFARIQGKNVPSRYEFKGIKKDGSVIYIEADVTALKEGNCLVGTRSYLWDITARKRAEEALRLSEEKYRTLADNINLGIYRNTAGPKGQFLEANPAIVKMFGYNNKEEFMATNVSDLYQNPGDREIFSKKLTGDGFVEDAELKLKKKDGTPFIGSISAVAVKDHMENVKFYDGIIEDITERKKVEEALWESEEKFRNLAEQSPNMIFIHAKGRVVYVNEKCEEIIGYRREEIYSPDFYFMILIGPEFREKMKANFDKHRKGEDVPPLEYELLTKDGKRIPAILTTKLIDYGKEKAILGIVTDIHEQKRAEKIKDSIYRISEAAHSAQNLEELFGSIHDTIGKLMPAKNFYIAVYDHDKELLSFPYFVDKYDETPAPKKLGKGLTEYVLRTGEPLLASPEVFEELEKKGDVESVGAPSIDWLGVPLKADHRAFGVLVVQSYEEGVRFGEKDKEILKFVSHQTAMAIKRKYAEEKLKESLREKEVLLQEVHHRVKNNMQIISSLLNLQGRNLKDQDTLKVIKDCQSRVRSMALVHEKLYMSQNFSQINFSDYVKSLAAYLFQLHQANPNSIQLRMNLDNIFLDIQRAIPCALILNELITNSLKYAFPEGHGGEVAVESHPLGDGTFQIVVKDNGVGIPDDVDIRNTKSLGLQIVSMLVDQLEGRMEVERKNGTTVKMAFKSSRT
jgi:PAS domain S-box-containing protein